MKLKNKVILLLGATSDIGTATAKALIDENAQLIISGRNIKKLEAIDDYAKEKNSSVIIAPLDLKEKEKIIDFAYQIGQKFHKLDALINCAGFFKAATPLTHYKYNDILQFNELNYLTNFLLIKAFEPLLIKAGKSNLVFLTDNIAKNCQAYFAPFNAAQAALEAMCKTYAAEVKHYNININLVRAELIACQRLEKILPGFDNEKFKQPVDVANIIIDILTSATYKTGEIVNMESPQYVK